MGREIRPREVEVGGECGMNMTEIDWQVKEGSMWILKVCKYCCQCADIEL